MNYIEVRNKYYISLFIKDLKEYKQLPDKNKYKYMKQIPKLNLEELTKEAFKPSRVNYILSINSDYEF